ncbi:MAG: ATP-dependent Clp protease ATP-binding subunit [Selenomonadaceae bacterium]|nr:ATP-dependent Clp protease ATP-binding subunit [Selenomonadaceae bacterium]
MDNYIPKWHKELELFTKVKPLIILEGNVLDSYQYPKDGSIVQLSQYLNYFFKDAGYQNVIFYDNLRGFYNTFEVEAIENFGKLVKADIDSGFIKSKFSGTGRTAPNIIRDALTQNKSSTAIVMDFASRYIITPEHMEQPAVDSFTVLLQASLETLKNLLVLVVNKVNDLPAWFYLQNPNVKIITLGFPSKEERENYVKGEKNFPSFFSRAIRDSELGYYLEHPAELAKLQDRFVALTDGFSFKEFNSLRQLCKNECRHIRDMCDIVDLYKYGIKENPWRNLDREKINKASFEKRVKGQDAAISKTLDIIKRAITGLAGLQGSSHSRPKGVLFFAGPTGTGKTETAKTLAEILFGDENCCIRFDMSEYSQGHSDQKLLGAPPGYIGYEAGGQLTNAVKKNPFSILLFDEIEKAHPSIFDKFLQILEDGRMTDGQGNTVYFSESIIIFTSNLGIFTSNEFGAREANVTIDMPYEEMSAKIRQAIENYFKINLGRPEILNRIGENIVVYDYIRSDVAKDILSAQINKIRQNLMTDKKIDVRLSDKAFNVLQESALKNLQNGGRGIGNVVESLFINPLARYLFDNAIDENAQITVDDITVTLLYPELSCSVE